MHVPRALLPVVAVLATSAGCTLAPFEPTVGSIDAGRDAAVAGDAGREADAGRDVDAGGGDGGRDAGRDAGAPDACVPAAELCNGVDDDCDPATPDGADDPALGGACDGSDADLCEDGAPECAGGAVRCADATDEHVETCNAADDDCDGLIDEDGCICPVARIGTSTYAFCTTRTSFASARSACEAFGYELATIEDATENAALTTEALSRQMDDWWIGLNDMATEGTFVWASGSTASYRNWASAQPSGGFGQDCVQLVDGSAGSSAGQWNDAMCSETKPFVCEVP